MKNKIFISVLLISLTFLSCGDDFLETEPTQFMSDQQIKAAAALDPNLAKASLTGVYSFMPQKFVGGTTGHDDFGHKSQDVFGDMLCSDMALTVSTYGWYRNICQLTNTTDYTQNQTYIIWRYYYRVIQGANSVIDGLGGNDAVLTKDGEKWSMGQAKALRAYAYFYLAQFYQKSYTPSELILPIYTDTKAPNQPKSSAADVYALIVKDLTDAVTLLETYNREAKYQINKHVAKALLAYAYGAMGDYPKVKTLTQEVITQSGLPLTTKAQAIGGFNDVNTASWMWGFDVTLANNLDLVSWWGQVDSFTYSYQWAGDRKAIDKGLFDQIKPTDVRKSQFIATPVSPMNSSYTLAAAGKFYDPAKIIGGQRNVTTDYIYMRIDEMYLLNAEASAKTGDESNAKTKLKSLLALRFDNPADYAYIDALTGTALQNEVYLQTRIELWGEGKSYLAMKRNKATITRGSNHLYLTGQSFQHDDPRLTFLIPQNEILNNPFIN